MRRRAKLAALGDGVIDIYSGNDDQIVPICSLGGIGVISVLSNVAPKETHDMVAYCLANRYDEALRDQAERAGLRGAAGARSKAEASAPSRASSHI